MNRVGRHLGCALALMVWLVAGCDGQSRSELDAARLEVLIDSLLPGIAETSGLEVRRPVRYELQSRSEARAFIVRQLDEEMGPAELAGLERSYRAFGLLPDTVELRSLLLELLTEQVVGYYDPPTDRLYVVEGVPASTAGPVVAHELVHALQDQHTSLDSLVAAERGNDRQMAAQAAAEGQAMLVMLALQAAESSGQRIDPGALPDLGPLMRPTLEAENARFPVFRDAPRLVRETLIFPYIAGAGFVQVLYRHTEGPGPPVPFGDLLPQSTEQVMHPERAFLGDRDAPTEIGLGDPREGWSVVYSNTLGQLEAGILLSERSGNAGESAPGWDGDRYALLEGSDGAEALVWYSVWDDDGSADHAAEVLASGSGAFPPEGVSVERTAWDGRPVVRLLIVRGGASPPEEAIPVIESMEEMGVL